MGVWTKIQQIKLRRNQQSGSTELCKSDYQRCAYTVNLISTDLDDICLRKYPERWIEERIVRSSLLAKTPEPPYYAVIFTSQRTQGDQGYGKMAERMAELAASQPGYLGVESARGNDGVGITVSYWKDEGSILAWKKNLEHTAARDQGRQKWYSAYELRVAKVERAYNWSLEE